jgi:chemotaxis protein MotB
MNWECLKFMAKKSDHKKEHHNAHVEHHHDDHDEGHGGGAHHGGEHEEGEPWLVSYADMMTLLFGFFVVMYSFAAKDPKNEECVRLKLMEAFKKNESASESDGAEANEASQSVAFKAVQMLIAMMNVDSVEEVLERLEEGQNQKKSGGVGQSDSSKDAKDKMTVDELKAVLGADEIKQTMSIALPVDIAFASGSVELLPEAKTRLVKVAQTINQIQNAMYISVIGHTDASAPAARSKMDNWSLSVLRASEVAKFMMAQGVDTKKLRVEGRGSAEPILPEKTADGRPIPDNMKRNRRIEIEVRKDKNVRL